MKLALMQPYFFPYIGYFQLINAVDKFIIYDTVNYIKNGWIKRNRYLLNETVKYLTLSIRNASSHRLIVDTFITEEENCHSKEKIVKTIHMAYSKAPYFEQVIPLLDRLILNEEQNISFYNMNILTELSKYLYIETEIILGSNVLKASSLTGRERVIEICENFKAKTYINPIGGMELYNKSAFDAHGIELFFLRTNDTIKYKQWGDSYHPNLSIIDMLMFNSKEEICAFLDEYTLI